MARAQTVIRESYSSPSSVGMTSVFGVHDDSENRVTPSNGVERANLAPDGTLLNAIKLTT